MCPIFVGSVHNFGRSDVDISTKCMRGFMSNLIKKCWKDSTVHAISSCMCNIVHTSRVSNIESDNSQNVGLEDYNNIFDGIFPHFTTPSIKISLG